MLIDLKVKIRDGRVKGLSGVQVIQVSEKEKQWENQFLIPKDVVKTTYIAAGDTSLGALQPSKASPHRPRHWNISMGILIVQASVMDDNIDTKIQMLQLENTQDKHSGKYW